MVPADDFLCVAKKVLKEIDLFSLIEHGAPEDEFDSEAEMLVERVKIDSSIEDISGIIADVFNKMFGVEIDGRKYMKEAEEIYEWLHPAK